MKHVAIFYDVEVMMKVNFQSIFSEKRFYIRLYKLIMACTTMLDSKRVFHGIFSQYRDI